MFLESAARQISSRNLISVEQMVFSIRRLMQVKHIVRFHKLVICTSTTRSRVFEMKYKIEIGL